MKLIHGINLIFLEVLSLMVLVRGIRIWMGTEPAGKMFADLSWKKSLSGADESGMEDRRAEVFLGGLHIVLGLLSAGALVWDFRTSSRMADGSFLFGFSGMLRKINISLTPACFLVLLSILAAFVLEKAVRMTKKSNM